MDESSKKQVSAQQQKQNICRRYRETEPKNLEVIPVSTVQPDLYDDEKPKRVAVYARVSTDDPRQTSSYELQKRYYEAQIEKHPNWTLAAIYADEGRSGTSIEKREEFNRMIEDVLTNLGFRTKKGGAIWSEGSVLQILQNERHCGAVRARKTFTPSYLDHKSRKNRGDRLQ